MIKEKELVITNNLNRSTISLDNVIRILNSKFFNKLIFNLLVSMSSHLKVFSDSTHHRMALQLLRLSRFKSTLFRVRDKLGGRVLCLLIEIFPKLIPAAFKDEASNPD